MNSLAEASAMIDSFYLTLSHAAYDVLNPVDYLHWHLYVSRYGESDSLTRCFRPFFAVSVYAHAAAALALHVAHVVFDPLLLV